MTSLLLGPRAALRALVAVALAVLVSALLIGAVGGDPLGAYGDIVAGVFADYWGFADMLARYCPLLLAGLAVIVPLRAGLFNIGGEGQIYMGALAGTVAGLTLPEMPPALGIPAISLAGLLGGALWGALPGWLKVSRGIDEVVTTLLLNYVAINLVSYAAGGPLKELGAPYPYSREVPDSLHLPALLPGTEAHLGLAVALLLALLVALVLRTTTLGFAVTLTGSAPRAAAYAGIAGGRLRVAAFAVGGALAGLAGAYEVIGVKYRLYHLFSGGLGFDGLVVAFLAAGSALAAILSALLVATLKVGATILKNSGVDATLVQVTQALIVLFAAAGLAGAAFTGWRRRRAAP